MHLCANSTCVHVEQEEGEAKGEGRMKERGEEGGGEVSRVRSEEGRVESG